MRTIRLYGSLGQEFGRGPFCFHVKTPAEAIRALVSQLPALRQRLLDYKGGPGFHVRVGKQYRGEDDVTDPCAESEVIRIVPATVGSGAAARIIAGAVLVVVGIIAYIYGGVLGQPLIQAGIALMIGGVAELLAPKPNVNGGDASDRPRSYTFGNSLNTTGQGVAVPVGYGMALVPSHVASSQIFSEEMPLDPNSPYVAPSDILGTDTATVSHVEGADATDYGNWTGREYGGGDGGEGGGGDGDGGGE